MSHQVSYEKEIEIDELPIRRALISVYDKAGLGELAQTLASFNVELYSTGGTEKFLREQGFTVHPITDLTGFPEMLDGRVKTLHPKVHGGLLYRRELQSHRDQVEQYGIAGIDLLISNLYPFEATIAKPGVTFPEAVEQIDIGGPAMLRSAAKNFKGVALLTAASQYQAFSEELKKLKGSTTLKLRLRLAQEAFESVAKYDRAIADYFNKIVTSESTQASNGSVQSLPNTLTLDLPRALPLRYGENPQQHAALYGEEFNQLFAQLWGKELSYNNILDSSAAAGLMAEFHDSSCAVAAIIKHTNPCGVGEGNTPLEAFERAFATDPESPFGGIIITNKPMDVALATRINEFFSEVILAPEFDNDALELLKKKKDRRLIKYDLEGVARSVKGMNEVRSIIGGILEQQADNKLMENPSMESITKRKLTEEEKRGLLFAWKVVKHVKSNAIVYAGITNGFSRTLGIGCGQTSRVESSRLAVEHAARYGHSLKGSLIASDAFFPFADGLLEAVKAGAVAAIEPGGSVRDKEVIQAAEDNNVALVMTGMRHFKH